jgi:hypothetical protein
MVDEMHVNPEEAAESANHANPDFSVREGTKFLHVQAVFAFCPNASDLEHAD